MFGIIPEISLLGDEFFVFYFYALMIVVKDTSSRRSHEPSSLSTVLLSFLSYFYNPNCKYKPIMKNTLLLALIFISFISEGQIKRISLRGGANYTSIENTFVHEDAIMIAPQYTGPDGFQADWVEAVFGQTFDSRAGAEFGAIFDCTIKGRFLVTTGLSMSLIRFQKKYPAIAMRTGGPTGFLHSYVPKNSYYGEVYPSPYFYDVGPYMFFYDNEKTGETSIASVQVPVLLGVSLLKNKLLIHAGGTISLVAYSSEYKVKFNGDDFREKNPENISKVFTSATANITYMVTKKLGIDLTGNYSLQSIYKNAAVKTTVYSLGVSYSLSK